jgi:hypothetical protein
VTFDQNEHHSTSLACEEDWLPRRYRLKARFMTKQVDEIHGYLLEKRMYERFVSCDVLADLVDNEGSGT